MQTVVTMKKGSKFRTFILSDNGSAKEKNKTISDFATRFIQLVENGWRKISETNLISFTSEEKPDLYITDEIQGFREQWYDYLEEYRDNLEMA